MKRPKERRKFIIFPGFLGYRLEVVVSKDLPGSVRAREKFYGPDTGDGNFYAMHIHNGQGIATILLPEHADVQSIAHECWHAVRAMFDFVNADLENECVAHHLGYLTQEAYDLVYRK